MKINVNLLSKVEEKLEDKLESENPNMDLEVSIYEDDDKKKSKKR
ncbi:hypothetical protein BAOM_2956 [Peribacillus asahii]|uniref:Uncharacterized protein n=1 Tax=Peribacillus asahii TaxID=228899 RepID=A0A3T0KTI9_9BACI|nr:hypothetical protein [Peribacillus asahii]AZV43565.1 hypothetical protein BAOM_2956 [Peribacillus asahii]